MHFYSFFIQNFFDIFQLTFLGNFQKFQVIFGKIQFQIIIKVNFNFLFIIYFLLLIFFILFLVLVLPILFVCSGGVSISFLLLYVYDTQIKHWNRDLFTWNFYKFLFIVKVEFILTILIKFVIFFFQLGSLFPKFWSLFKKL
jgi:hypothetical protein